MLNEFYSHLHFLHFLHFFHKTQFESAESAESAALFTLSSDIFHVFVFQTGNCL